MCAWIVILLISLNVAHGAVSGSVRAESGDGIYSLLKRHGLSGKESVKSFIELNKENLGPNNTLYKERLYKLPPVERALKESLFGDSYENVEVIDQRLAGAVFYLISGHGGPDPGGIGKDGNHTLYEDEYAYDITLRFGRRLMEHGAQVYFIIRDPESGIQDARYLSNSRTEVCYPNQKIPLNQKARLHQRTAAVNKLYRSQNSGSDYKRCVAIHVDARKKHEMIDLFFYHHQNSGLGKRLAETMRKTVKEKYGINQPGRVYKGTVASRNLYVVRETVPPVVFIEVGNIHHKRDQARLTEPNNRQAIANWLCEGILRDHES